MRLFLYDNHNFTGPEIANATFYIENTDSHTSRLARNSSPLPINSRRKTAVWSPRFRPSGASAISARQKSRADSPRN